MYPIENKDAYARWAREQDELSAADRQAIIGCVARMIRRPLFSIVVLISQTAQYERWRRVIASVRSQLYPCWEILASPELLSDWHDPRAIAITGAASDLVALYNTAVSRANGQFIVFLPPDAILEEHALFELANLAAADPELDIIYTDEDCKDDAGNRSHPHFKTGWDPDLMLGRDAIGSIAALRISTVRRLGGMRRADSMSDLDLAQYDLVLRIGADVLPRKIAHVPAILCHRSPPGERSSCRSNENTRQIVRRHLAETGLRSARVEAAPLAPAYNHIKHPITGQAPLVSIIVPTRDQAEMLARCADGVLSRTDYTPVELIIVDNDSQEPVTHALFSELTRDPRVRVLSCPGPFNFSSLNNKAAEVAQGEILLLLNNDTEVIAPGWLSELVSHALRPEIGAVGAKLLYANGKVQHCGVTMGPGWGLMHQLRLSDRNDPGPGAELALVRSVSAVTAACLAIRKSVFMEVGGLDAVNFPIAFNDVDLCLRLGDHGYRVICTPFAELFHLESVSRGYDITPEKELAARQQSQTFREIWEPILDSDPYHNPNLIFRWESAEYAAPTRRWRAWHPITPGTHGSFEHIYRSAPSTRSMFPANTVSPL